MRLGFAARVIACLALAALAAFALRRAMAVRNRTRVEAAQAADSAALATRRIPRRERQGVPPGADSANVAKGGPWYVICARHTGGYCSDPYFDFDTATARAEQHRRRMGLFCVGVSTSCPY
jgi:hypothetical protein